MSADKVPIALNLDDLLLVAQEAVGRASKLFREGTPGVITVKGDRDPATEVDYAVERAVRDFLLAEAPHVRFLGEEDGIYGAAGGELTWALDPVDGTVNYMHGVPLCGISLGLVQGEEPVLGVIDLPFLGMRYTARKGGGAHRDGERLTVQGGPQRIADAVVAIGDYAVGRGASRKNEERFRVTHAIATHAQRVRMFGSAAVDLAWVADGRIGASIMLNNKPWDTAAGVLIAREAGAVVVDRTGSEHRIYSSSTVAVAPSLADELLEVLRF